METAISKLATDLTATLSGIAPELMGVIAAIAGVTVVIGLVRRVLN